MIFEHHPVTAELHKYQREKIIDKFPLLEGSNESDYLSVYQYLEESPQRFYSKKAFEDYLDFLTDLKSKNVVGLKKLLNSHEREFNLAFRYLTEINSEEIHENILSKDYLDLIYWIDKNLLYSYLKLVEGVWAVFLYPISHVELLARGKKTDGLKQIMTRVEVINKTKFSYLSDCYSNTIRNGIAHGDISYSDSQIIFKDNRGNEKELGQKEFAKWFDRLVDYCNGIALAFKVFFLGDSTSINKLGVSIPRQILISELQAKIDSPRWKLLNVLDTKYGPRGTSQLIIYCKDSVRSYNHAMYHCLRTASIVEKFIPEYDRYFFHLDSKYATVGWAGFNGKILKQNRINEHTDVESYHAALEEGYIFFVPKIKLPELYHKVSNVWLVFRKVFPLYWKRHTAGRRDFQFKVRDVQSHSKGRFLAVIDPSVVIDSYDEPLNFQEIIRANKQKIVNQCKAAARKEYSWFSIEKYLPIRYVRLFIYQKDMRKRHLRHSGLVSDLIATIEVNKSQIQTIDILGGTVEVHGKYRIVWN